MDKLKEKEYAYLKRKDRINNIFTAAGAGSVLFSSFGYKISLIMAVIFGILSYFLLKKNKSI